MLRSKRFWLWGFTLFLIAVIGWFAGADRFLPKTERQKLLQMQQQGNYRDAYEGFRRLALDPDNDPKQVGSDLDNAVNCLRNLGREDEIDAFREAVIEVHKDNWRLLEAAARSYAQGKHHGYLIAGKFHRGGHRGGGRFVNSWPRDRGRALQLMHQALQKSEGDRDKAAVAQLHLVFAGLLLGQSGQPEPWRLQYLTDFSQLPDYEDGDHYHPNHHHRGAPTDEKGNPILHYLPESFETAKTDGERWRWLLARAAELDPSLANEIDMQWAFFLHRQFGVQTLAQGGVPFGRDADRKDQSGTFALHTLGDDETIARLATGIKRFQLPEEFHYIAIYQRVAGRGKSEWGEKARDALVAIYENRRQYSKAAEALREAIREYGRGHEDRRQKHLNQIVGNWGRFEPGQVQPAGTAATVDYRFRNGSKVRFEAFAIEVPKLLDDVKDYLKSNPRPLDHDKIQIGNIGYRLVERQQGHYLGKKVAAWDLDLQPRPDHVDDRVTVTTPLDKPGAYLLTAQMADGNLSRIIVWVSDTVIVRKPLDGRVMYYVADAMSGKPVAGAEVEFFGWRSVLVDKARKDGHYEHRVETTCFQQMTNADGQVVLGADKMNQQCQWLVTARKPQDGPGGADRFAYLGFSSFWFDHRHDAEYHQTKVFTITDRPVYRPQQTVRFKAWAAHAKYDQPDASPFAGRLFTVRINDPKGEKVFEASYVADEYGGVAGEFALPRDTTLGMYHIQIMGGGFGGGRHAPGGGPPEGPPPPFGAYHLGGGHFRVEEYKKPEFEVTIEAPKEPVRLGEQVIATIQAKYYFGAPVTRAKVKYKVTRSSHSGQWYPAGTWDWLYGPGYWWFAGDYVWYPGWNEWGCYRPIPWWWNRGTPPPELVFENEVSIGPDGTVKVPIDTWAAKELHGDQDHQYTITAEVVDESRRTITGSGTVLVARKPFQVFAWVDHGHYRVGDTVTAGFHAHTLDRKPVAGKGKLTLYRISYNRKNQPVEKAVQTWDLDTNAEGHAALQIKAAQAGQYRLSYRLTDAKQHTVEGGYVFVVRGEGFDGKDYRFNDLELVTDKREYAPGEPVKLLVNTNRAGGTVLLFVRPTNGVYLPPKVLRLQGKSVEEEIAVVQRDMPNFFIEALTVAGGRVHTETREVLVPPEKRILNVEVLPSQAEYKPGQKATVKVKLTDLAGKPFVGSTVMSIYDKSVEYISGGSNVPEIRAFFWKWRRHHRTQTETSIAQQFHNLLRTGEIGMSDLGVHGQNIVEELAHRRTKRKSFWGLFETREETFSAVSERGATDAAPQEATPAAGRELGDHLEEKKDEAKNGDARGATKQPAQAGQQPPGVQPTVRSNFADTAFWTASLTTDSDGVAEVSLTMPENLTGWKVKVWAMGHGTRVGQGEAEVVTKKDLLVRLQAPRFFVQKDEVVLSANVHNYLKTDKDVTVSLELGTSVLSPLGQLRHTVRIPAKGEKRIDWRVRVLDEGEAVVRMKAVSDEESDAMEMRFPSFIHGMLKTESFSGVVRPDREVGTVFFTVPVERRVEQSRVEVRFSPTLAGAMVDALPYLVDYPYGCTEQTLNRFLPTVITQRILQRMNLNLKDIEQKRTNLNAQEIGDARERAKRWQRLPRNPVFNEAEVRAMTQTGVQRLAAMQCSDGGWGWFSGYGEHSYPHTTAVVVHGLQLAQQSQVPLPGGMLERGIEWLKRYQDTQTTMLRNAALEIRPWKSRADELDAFVYMILVDAGHDNPAMRDYLYRDRLGLAVYAKAMLGIALHKQQQTEQLAMILRNLDQFLVQDDENQTAYLKLPGDSCWWCWHGSDIETNAYYLKLLSRTNPKDRKTAGLVKYLLNNRKHATYWTNTRDTAICIEAMADYLVASGEDKPDMTVEVWLDGKKHKEVKITAENLFTFDNQFVLTGDAVEAGKHELQIRRKGTGPVYFNAYVTNFTLEDFITRAGLEVKVNRKYYKLTRIDKSVKVSGSRGQALDQKVERYKRTELKNLDQLKSGDLVEVELEIDSKNDYEYLIFEDPKAAGFEPLLVQSGYNPNEMGAYMELRDDRVCFFVRQLARGKHSVSYRLRAEIPGKFSALPTRAYAMYAPELRGNSDEIKLRIED